MKRTIVVPAKPQSHDHVHDNFLTLSKFNEDADGVLNWGLDKISTEAQVDDLFKTRDKALRPYIVRSYSVFLLLSTGLPSTFLEDFGTTNLIDADNSVGLETDPYDVTFINSGAKLTTVPLDLNSRRHSDGLARKIYVSPIPRVPSIVTEVQLVNSPADLETAAWVPIPAQVFSIPPTDGLRVRFTVDPDLVDEVPNIYGFYVMYE